MALTCFFFFSFLLVGTAWPRITSTKSSEKLGLTIRIRKRLSMGHSKYALSAPKTLFTIRIIDATPDNHASFVLSRIQVFNFVVAIAAALLVDIAGRRPLFLASNGGMLLGTSTPLGIR